MIGGGAGGVTAALSACERGVPATLVERSDKGAFGTQLESTRYIDPAMDDWPASHWGDAAWPLRGRRASLPWRASPAAQVAGFWEACFEAKLVALGGGPEGRLHFAKGIHVQRQHLLLSEGDVRFNWRAPERPEEGRRHGAAIVCTGFSKEETGVSESYRGFEFWGPDPYGLKNLGLDPSVRVKALVSGAGGGALQDFLRLVMRPGTTARDVLQQVEWADSELLSCPHIFRAEDEASRARQCGLAPPARPCRAGTSRMRSGPRRCGAARRSGRAFEICSGSIGAASRGTRSCWRTPAVILASATRSIASPPCSWRGPSPARRG